MFGLPRIVWLLGFISFINDTSSELIYPLIPLYLSSVLLAGPQILGVIEGLVESLGSILKLFSGILSDKLQNNKWLVVSGYTLSSIIKPLLAFAFIWPLILLLRISDRVGKALRTAPRDALLAESVNPKILGKAFGFHRAMDNAGAVVGPLLASLLLWWGFTLQQVFLWTILPGIICVVLTLAIREPKRKTVEKSNPADTKTNPLRWKFKSLAPSYKRYLLILALFSLGNSSNMFLLLRAKDLGLSATYIPLLWALTSFSASIFSTPLSALSDSLGRKPLIIGGWVIYGIFYLTLSFQQLNTLSLWPLFAFYGVFIAATEGTEKAFVADLAEKTELGTAYGWFNMVSGIMLFPASLFFGIVWQYLQPEIAFVLSSGLAFLAACLLKWWLK